MLPDPEYTCTLERLLSSIIRHFVFVCTCCHAMPYRTLYILSFLERSFFSRFLVLVCISHIQIQLQKFLSRGTFHISFHAEVPLKSILLSFQCPWPAVVLRHLCVRAHTRTNVFFFHFSLSINNRRSCGSTE